MDNPSYQMQPPLAGGGSEAGVMPPSSAMNLPSSNNEDPFDFEGIAPTTVAMVILFGSIMFATVAMATRALLWGDKRAIIAAISIKVNSAVSNTNFHSGNSSYIARDEYLENSIGGESSSLYPNSVASRLSSHTNGTNMTNARIRPWEPTFISTFVLFYQVTLFGMILFIIYLLDNHPPHGAARSQSTYLRSSSNSEFDEDQFIFWLMMFVAYAYFMSWRRNDGRPSKSDHKPNLPSKSSSKPPSVAQSENILRRRKFGTGRRGHTVGSSAGSKSSASTASSQGSDDISKRLEDVLLDKDDDDTSFNNMLDTIDGEIRNKKDQENMDWMEQTLRFFGFHNLSEEDNLNTGVIQDVKPEEDVLNRYQTLEWKGFLSAALLIYQFNNGGIHQISLNDEDVVENGSMGDHSRANVYANLCNVAMSSFLFLSGYGHTSYFYYHPARNNHDSYRMSRVLGIICRINLTAIFLSLVVGKVEYMACPVTTYCFLLIWLTMRFRRSINYDKFLFRMKLFGLAICIFIVWDCDISKAFSYNVTQNSFWEWYCMSHTHHWAAFMGVIFAINQPIASLQLRKLESLHTLINIMAKGLIVMALCAAVTIWTLGPLQMSTFAYSISHPYFGIIPVLAMIYLRNICGTVREHHIGMMSLLGKYSLEVYLLHYHAFTDSGCVVFIPGYPRCNFTIVSILLLFAARVLNHLTTILRHMLLPENEERKCLQQASAAFVLTLTLCVLARALTWADMVSVGTISTITIVCGILLYQTVVDMTWADYRDSGLKLAQHHHSSSSDPDLSVKSDLDESTTAKVSPPLIGTLVFVVAWCVWTFSGSSLQPCGASANNGHWIPVNPCSSRGKLHREFHATNYINPNECSESNANLQWTWPENSQHTHCNYRYRSDMEVQQKLQGKKVVLIGDSSVRSLFQSLCRFMGDHNADYEDTPSHSDAIKTYGSSTLEYKWAPLTVDIVTKLRGLKSSGFAAPMKRQPDLVIAGGGAWDKLHLSVTDEDPQSQRETVTKLVRSLSEVSVPVVWFVPPTINTQALNSDEKRVQMNEESIQEMRQMYEELGVTSSVAFVLDGPSFTRERVKESFDGVHYISSTYDAGVQILINALDWLMIATDSAVVDSYLPKPGSLGIPYLGLMIICITMIGLFFFDGYFGFSYLAQFFVMNDTVSPGELYEDAFTPIFKRLKISQNYERMPDTLSYDVSDKHEVNELIGRSSSSLSRRR